MLTFLPLSGDPHNSTQDAVWAEILKLPLWDLGDFVWSNIKEIVAVLA